MTQIFSPDSGRTVDSPPTGDQGVPVVNLSANPSLDEAALVGRMRNLFQRARTERKPWVNQWMKNHRVMRNRTWLTTRESWLPSPEVPEVRPIIASCVAWVTDQRPSLELAPAAQPFSPYYDQMDKLADDMKTAINAAWVTYQWENEIQKAVWDAYVYDVGYLKTVWDASLAYGLGDVALRRVDPFTFYPDPQATCMEDANYFIEARTVSLQELDRRFPGSAERFELQGYTENIDEMPRSPHLNPSAPRANPGAIAPATTARYGLPGQTSRDSVAIDDRGVTLLECWVREHTAQKDDQGINRIYECWRVICVAGPHILLNKRADEVSPFRTHPYDRYTPEDMGEFFGQSMVELLSPSQLAVNRLLSAMQQSVELTGNPPFVEDSRSNISRTKIPNRPGVRLTKSAGGTAEWMTPPAYSPQSGELVKFYITEMEKISGLSAISRGLVPGGRLASDVLDSVQESGFVRIRLSLRNLEFCLRNVGQKVAAYIGEFYTEPRLVSLVGPEGSKTSRTLGPRHFYMPGPDGAAPLRFQVLVYAGSMLPTSRQARISEADTLFAMNAIDRQALLDAHDTPNRDRILERMSEMDSKGIVQGPGARQAAGRTT